MKKLRREVEAMLEYGGQDQHTIGAFVNGVAPALCKRSLSGVSDRRQAVSHYQNFVGDLDAGRSQTLAVPYSKTTLEGES